MRTDLKKITSLIIASAILVLFPTSVYAFDDSGLYQPELPEQQEQEQQLLPTPALALSSEDGSQGPTYIDVSIEDQTLVYYINGIPALVTPCVTGSPGRSTPRGVFAINSCIPGKYLKGPTWNVWVNRWMRFAGNCGIHDATWRKQFGGDIYKRNGSHGCVNIPKDQAYQLYSMVGIGTVVIVH